MSQPSDSDILRQTLRTVGILVGACVLFVGVLSASAVAITNKAIGTSHEGATESSSSTESAPSPNKTGSSRSHDLKPAQRPQSI